MDRSNYHRGGHSGRGGHGSSGDRPKREAILDLEKYRGQEIIVKFAGGREAVGVLKGFDQLLNLVLDDVRESLRDADGQVTDKTRQIGLVVVRGTTITLIAPADGSKEIANPFTQQD